MLGRGVFGTLSRGTLTSPQGEEQAGKSVCGCGGGVRKLKGHNTEAERNIERKILCVRERERERENITKGGR